jgi:uncharacterized protein
MRILVFTDTHGNDHRLSKVIEKSKNADLVVCCGDMTVFENDIDKILSKINSMDKLTLVIPGNHESDEGLKRASARFKNIFYLHGTILEHDGLTFVGFGGGGFGIRDVEFERFIKLHEDRLKNKKIVFVTHGPPFKTTLDFINNEHVGNKSYADFIKKHKPLVHFCGHIHENFSSIDRIDGTFILNPGPDGRIFPVKVTE